MLYKITFMHVLWLKIVTLEFPSSENLSIYLLYHSICLFFAHLDIRIRIIYKPRSLSVKNINPAALLNKKRKIGERADTQTYIHIWANKKWFANCTHVKTHIDLFTEENIFFKYWSNELLLRAFNRIEYKYQYSTLKEHLISFNIYIHEHVKKCTKPFIVIFINSYRANTIVLQKS